MQVPNVLHELFMGLGSLLAHKLRTLLTMLGMIFGVGAVDAAIGGFPVKPQFLVLAGLLAAAVALCPWVGAAAIRFPGQTLKYDAKKARFTNNDEANKLLAPPYREGWTLT